MTIANMKSAPEKLFFQQKVPLDFFKIQKFKKKKNTIPKTFNVQLQLLPTNITISLQKGP